MQPCRALVKPRGSDGYQVYACMLSKNKVFDIRIAHIVLKHTSINVPEQLLSSGLLDGSFEDYVRTVAHKQSGSRNSTILKTFAFQKNSDTQMYNVSEVESMYPFTLSWDGEDLQYTLQDCLRYALNHYCYVNDLEIVKYI